LQQLDRLLKLRRHNELLAQPHLQLEIQSHLAVPKLIRVAGSSAVLAKFFSLVPMALILPRCLLWDTAQRQEFQVGF
jgi:hypothetical protein